MGSFIGHAATGSVFWLGGLFYLLRAMGLRILEPMRWNPYFLQAPAWTNIIGGIIYSIGEWYRMGTYSMQNTQHYLMASTFVISGVVQLLHMRGYLRGLAWSLVSPINWFILGLLFNFHPQKDPSSLFGHLAMGWLFGVVTILESVQFLMGYYCHNPRAESHNGPILAMYKNPKVYGTPVPTLIGITLMILGFIDWDMAIDFGKEGDMQGSAMQMEMDVVMHVFANVIFSVILTLIMKQLDSYIVNRCGLPISTGDSSNWIASDDDKVWQFTHVVLSPETAKPLEMHEL